MLALDLATKSVVCAEPETTLVEACRIMHESHVGSLVVVDSMDFRKPLGILTDRDIVLKIAQKYDLSSQIFQVMSKRIITVPETETLDSAFDQMKFHRIRRLVIVDSQGLVRGILTADDLLRSGRYQPKEIGEIMEGQAWPEGLKERTLMC